MCIIGNNQVQGFKKNFEKPHLYVVVIEEANHRYRCKFFHLGVLTL